MGWPRETSQAEASLSSTSTWRRWQQSSRRRFCCEAVPWTQVFSKVGAVERVEEQCEPLNGLTYGQVPHFLTLLSFCFHYDPIFPWCSLGCVCTFCCRSSSPWTRHFSCRGTCARAKQPHNSLLRILSSKWDGHMDGWCNNEDWNALKWPILQEL